MEPEKTRQSPRGREPETTWIRDARVAVLLMLACTAVLVLSCWFGGHSCSARPDNAEVVSSVASFARSGMSAASQETSATVDGVAAVCELISQGRFEAARERITGAKGPQEKQIRGLRRVVDRYDEISRLRKAAKKTVFNEQLEELERLKSFVDLKEGALAATSRDSVDPNLASAGDDAQEPNDLTDVLAVLAKATEFADEQQKADLLSNPYVVKVLQEAVDRSILLEAEGKWLDAYTNYYYWLQAVDPNNSAYSDRAEELLDRASIAASFQDSPCETRSQRYEGVEERMFDRAIEALNLHYVNSIDYAKMATKAIKHCDLLAEVLAIAFADGSQLSSAGSFKAPEPEKVTAWSVALAGLLDEIEGSVEGMGKDEFLEVLDKVLALNDMTVELPRRPLVAHFAEAALETLDPYTVMVWPRQVQDFEKLMTNEFTGIGIEISKPKGLLTVSSLLPDTPAYRSGLDAGDVIESVDGVPTKDMSLMCAVKKITGPKGTKVDLTIRRRGEEDTRTIAITRDRIIVPTIRGWQRTETGKWLYMVDDEEKIGYVRVTSFSGETAGDLAVVLGQLKSQGLKGLVLDLRFNTGGLLDSAVDVTDTFISEGLIVRTQPKASMIPAYEHAHRRGTQPDYPLVILINASSASASEIVAGALADEKHERAVLVGTRTHGKGSVQGITHYPGAGAELKYTMAYYHLPSGQRVKSREVVERAGAKDWGVGPDVEVKLTSEELKTWLDVQRDNDVLVQAHRNGNGTTLNKRTLDETLQADPQLAVALLVVKAKLLQGGAAVVN